MPVTQSSAKVVLPSLSTTSIFRNVSDHSSSSSISALLASPIGFRELENDLGQDLIRRAGSKPFRRRGPPLFDDFERLPLTLASCQPRRGIMRRFQIHIKTQHRHPLVSALRLDGFSLELPLPAADCRKISG